MKPIDFHPEAFSVGSACKENEDAYAVEPHPADPHCLLIVVADGMGGQPSGGPAARLACRKCVEFAAATNPIRLRMPNAWASILGRVDHVVTDDPGCGLTTLIGLSIVGDWISGASVGDSAVGLVCADRPFAVLTEQQFKDPPVGTGAANAVGFSAALVHPWTLLAMTDGVWKYAGWTKIRVCVEGGRGQDILNTLRDSVRLRSGVYQDDFTLVVARSE